MTQVKVSTKGQVVLPSELRRELDIRPGASVDISREGTRLVLTPIPDDPVAAAYGALAHLGPMLPDMLEERRRERQREEERLACPPKRG